MQERITEMNKKLEQFPCDVLSSFLKKLNKVEIMRCIQLPVSTVW